jgi:DNA excision repair protein ERCC-2
VYAYLYATENNTNHKKQIVTVAYIQPSTFQVKYFREKTSYEVLRFFFLETCEHFCRLIRDITQYQTIRDQSITNLSFPYTNLRDGQKDFMKNVLSSARNREFAMIQAPTGIGKTVSVLFPCVKAIPYRYHDYIFYLTGKTSTQEAAKNTLSDLREKGLILRSIHITAKEKICLNKEIYCDLETCPYALSYYENAKQAIHELLRYHNIDYPVLQTIARKYQVCPFEIGLDISLFCDVIICDYNYIFDPRVMLVRFMTEDSYRFMFLVDEAHNLPDRTNEMYSASISEQQFQELFRVKAIFSGETQAFLERIGQYFTRLHSLFDQSDNRETEFDSSISSGDSFLSQNTCASRKIPRDLVKILTQFTGAAKSDMDRIKNRNHKKLLSEFYFSMKFFIKVSEEFFDSSYILLIQKEQNMITVSLRCLNSSRFISQFNNGKHSGIFFSATLQPEDYFSNLLKDTESTRTLTRISYSSPFPPENLLIGIVTHLSVKYHNRIHTLDDIASIIRSAISCKKGNYLIFSPSFEYMNWISKLFSKSGETQKIIIQKRDMTPSEKLAFLHEFQSFQNNSLIGFAVLGGIFGEGIDLVGDCLSGVMIIGVGLPQRSVCQDILKDYYHSMFGNGYDYAYRFPGFNKVLQAAGRVIRSDTDRGFVILIDERYDLPEYRSLFPEEWNVQKLISAEDIHTRICDFFIH